MEHDKKFLRDVQAFIANCITISAVRNMGPAGTLESIREFLKQIKLDALEGISPSSYPQKLNRLTKLLQRRLPAPHWGVARKCLNCFFRDAFYNFYLRRAYRLERFEEYFEIPLDRSVGEMLRHHRNRLPKWESVKRLTPEISAIFQAAAAEIPQEQQTKRVHLDVEYWRKKYKK